MPFKGHSSHFSNCVLNSSAKCLLKFKYLHCEMLDSIQSKIYPDICWPPINKAQWTTFYKWGTKAVGDISQETWAFVSHFLQLIHSELQSTLSVCAVFLSALNHFLSLIVSCLSPPTLSLRCSCATSLSLECANFSVWPQSFLYKNVQLMRNIIKSCFLKYAIFNI